MTTKPNIIEQIQPLIICTCAGTHRCTKCQILKEIRRLQEENRILRKLYIEEVLRNEEATPHK